VIDIGFKWSRGHDYECVPWANDKTVQIIRQVGRATDLVEPLGIPSKLFLRFANLKLGKLEVPIECLTFAKHFGLLQTPASPGAAEQLEGWVREIRKMKGLISAFGLTSERKGGILRSARLNFKAPSIEVSLESREPGKRPDLIMRPSNLRDLMLLQMAQTVATDGSIDACQECGNFFEIGVGGARRSIAKFCSERCKNHHHYKLRKQRAEK
jgi:hypothetical protein